MNCGFDIELVKEGQERVVKRETDGSRGFHALRTSEVSHTIPYDGWNGSSPRTASRRPPVSMGCKNISEGMFLWERKWSVPVVDQVDGNLASPDFGLEPDRVIIPS